MTDSLTIARPYTKAIFSQAAEANQLHEWLQWLQSLALIAKNPQMRQIIISPRLSSQQLADIFFDLLSSLFDFSATSRQAMKNFIELLSENKRLSLLDDIANLFAKMLADQESTVYVEAFSAHPFAEQQKKTLQAALEKRFNAKVKVSYHADESLIGGTLIRANNWVMDGTIRGKLSRLAENLS